MKEKIKIKRKRNIPDSPRTLQCGKCTPTNYYEQQLDVALLLLGCMLHVAASAAAVATLKHPKNIQNNHKKNPILTGCCGHAPLPFIGRRFHRKKYQTLAAGHRRDPDPQTKRQPFNEGFGQTMKSNYPQMFVWRNNTPVSIGVTTSGF